MRIKDETCLRDADLPDGRVRREGLAAGPRCVPFERERIEAMRLTVRVNQDGESPHRFAARLINHAIDRQIPPVVELSADPVPGNAFSGCVVLRANELEGLGLAELVVVPGAAAYDTLARAVKGDGPMCFATR